MPPDSLEASRITMNALTPPSTELRGGWFVCGWRR
jgi:hypothetical protein